MGESLLAKLCTRTTCHGPLDFFQSKGLGRLFWALITLGAFAAVGYYGYMVTAQYLQGQSATSISVVAAERLKFPNVTICNPMRHNSTWIKSQVMIPPGYMAQITEDTGLDEEGFKREFSRYIRILSFGVEYYNQALPKANKLVEYMEMFYQHLFNSTSSITDINQFLDQAAFDCSAYLTRCTFNRMPFDCCHDRYVRKTFSDNGYCYMIDISGNDTFAYQTSKGEDFGLEVTVQQDMADAELISSIEEIGLRIHVGDYATTMDANPIGVPTDVQAHIQLKPVHYILDETIDQCLPHGKHLPGFETYTKKNCEMYAFEQLCKDIMGCDIATGVIKRDPATLCSPLPILQKLLPRLIGVTADAREYKDAVLKHFSKECPKLCDYWEYRTFVSYSDITNVTHSSRIKTMKVSVYFSALEYQEYQNQLLTDANTFVSNLGGIVGLWTGISIISIIQCLAIMIFGPCEDNPGCCGCTKKKS